MQEYLKSCWHLLLSDNFFWNQPTNQNPSQAKTHPKGQYTCICQVPMSGEGLLSTQLKEESS